jgi:hypothetical protein
MLYKMINNSPFYDVKFKYKKLVSCLTKVNDAGKAKPDFISAYSTVVYP